MNQQMWKNPAVQQNITLLTSREIQVLGPAEGEQACGDIGLGRMTEPYEIVDSLQQAETPRLLDGIRVLITAGATREAIDPVRFITNRSSGKMGYSIANAAKKMGADVVLVSGIVALPAPDNVQRIVVESASDMYAATMQQADSSDIFIATAAVSDYSPKDVIKHKIKKTADQIVIEVTKNPDILAELSSQFPQVFTVGFAAETNDLIYYARRKMENKKLDMIAANWVGDGKGFDQADNALEVLWQDGQKSLPQMSKQQLAKELLILVADKFNKDKTNANN
jgi:phosphopantothenoylcysteine decarboxylase/phosphopantothenate--cysteine ligase